ncbi:hypothetical protein E3P99_03841 [Wallemia hederae]|uniref:Protein ARV n=1 Tax=Wallemia hederae TaxID=1540922 RepID=A0A4T0FF96_9BASI|nr:hypothetical protein E3P99_03841 [Wallemia hederae]
MAICIHCQSPVSYVATKYSLADTRIELCPNCRKLSDPYIGKRNISLLKDLVVLKPGVLRHLLFNRADGVALSERFRLVSNGRNGRSNNHSRAASASFRSNTSGTIHLARLASILIVADAFVQWVHCLHDSHHSLTSFFDFLFTALVDAVAYHFGVIIAVRALKAGSHISTTQISLAILYSSFAKLFLLLLLVIADPSSGGHARHARQARQAHTNLLQHLYTALDDNQIDRPWIVNTIVGGMSAGFGLRVLLNTPPITSTLVILAGWATRSLALHVVQLYL